jgi:hypothetical protein
MDFIGIFLNLDCSLMPIIFANIDPLTICINPISS